jgi:uncharacterized protein
MVPALEGAAGAGPLDDARAADRRGDYVTEFRLLRPLAVQGKAEAQTALGLIYDAGRGVPQDYVEAVKWYRCAADQGFTDAGAGFNVEAGLRDNIAADMTPAQITEAQRRAREWRPKTPSGCQ